MAKTPSKSAAPGATPATTPTVEKWPLSRFKAYLDNPREHKKEAVTQFAKAILRFGFRVPVLARFSTGELADGHFRLKAAEEAGLTEVLVMDCDDMSEQEIRAFRLSVNRIPELAQWAQDPLLRELEALPAPRRREARAVRPLRSRRLRLADGTPRDHLPPAQAGAWAEGRLRAHRRHGLQRQDERHPPTGCCGTPGSQATSARGSRPTTATTSRRWWSPRRWPPPSSR